MADSKQTVSDDLDGFLQPIEQRQKPTPEHRAWMNNQIQTTLDKKQRGELKYTPLEDVRKEFGF